MQVQINSDNATAGSEQLSHEVGARIEASLSRFSHQITRVEVHLSDLGGDQSRCVIEARLEGLRPISVSNKAGTLAQAVDGCATKMATRVESTLGRLQNRATH